MPRVRQVKTTFTAGEVSRRLLGRGDLRAYENGALSLRNLFIHPTGGVSRRSGLRFVDTIPGAGRLIAFEFNTQQTFLMVLTDELLSIYGDDTLITTLATPWTEAQIAQLSWTQSADTLLLVHPDVPAKRVTRDAGGTWSIDDWAYISDGNVIRQPYFKFVDPAVTLISTATSGSVTLTASASVFDAGHVGARLRIRDKEVEITGYSSPTVVSADIIETLPSAAATTDWKEQAFSAVRGYPVSVAFHQDRLIIGGSRDLPNRLWMSKSGDLFNFDLGTGLDDEAIEFGIFSDQVNAIRAVFSGRDLQVLTSGAEWQVRGDPLTPETVQLNRQTRIGSMIDRYIPPVDVDGATLFIARNGREVREFVFTDLEQAYKATDIALLARHIINNPVDQDFDKQDRLLHVILGDGNIATLTIHRVESVTAWTLHETQGDAKSVAVVGEDAYVMVDRGGTYTIEKFDDTLNLDSALTGTSGTPVTTWSGLDHLEGQEVSIVADGVVLPDQTVSGGEVTLAEAASAVEIGLSYTHIIEPLPPNLLSNGGAGRATRMVEAIFRLEDTAALRLDVGRGLKDVALRKLGQDPILDAAPPQVSGDYPVRAFGWHKDGSEPLWRIEQSVPLPFTLLSVTMELKIND